MSAIRAFILLPGLALWLIGLSPAAQAQSVEGVWYGWGYQPAWGEGSDFIIHRWSDGRSEIWLRHYSGCVVTMEQRETSTWSMADASTVHVKTLTVNGEAGDWTEDDYRILELTADRYRYLHLQTGVEYNARRVDENFTFPECGPMS